MSNTTQHTPGPWMILPGSDNREVWSYALNLEDGPHRICHIQRLSMGRDEQQQANATLIAAAPETAAERDRLKQANAGLHTANENVRVELGRAQAINAELVEALKNTTEALEAATSDHAAGLTPSKQAIEGLMDDCNNARAALSHAHEVKP